MWNTINVKLNADDFTNVYLLDIISIVLLEYNRYNQPKARSYRAIINWQKT